MRIAIFSDIHGNLEAFKAVIKVLQPQNLDAVISLGDLIGYGPEPNEVVKLFMDNGYISVLGNHEAALSDTKMRNWLNFQAKENSIQTEKLLSQESLDFCCNLSLHMSMENALFVHGFPPKSVLEYITMKSAKDLQKYLATAACDLTFVGHTHDLYMVSWDGKKLHKTRFEEKTYTLQRGIKYIVNAGSVGQPRDGNNSAKYVVWDTDADTLEIFYVPYDIETTHRKIKERGFPEAYGLRLW